MESEPKREVIITDTNSEPVDEIQEIVKAWTGEAGTEAAPAAPEPAKQPEPPKPEPTKAEDDFASRFSSLTKKDKKLREKEREIKQAEQRAQEMEQKYNSLMSEFESDPVGFLQKHKKMTFTDIVEQSISEGKKPAIEDRMAKIEKAAAEIEEMIANKKKEAEQSKAEQLRAAQRQQNLQGVQAFVEQNLDKYELIKEYNRYEDLLDLIQEATDRYGFSEDLIPRCAELLEQDLDQTGRAVMDRLQKIKKFQAQQAQVSNAPAKETPEDSKPEDSESTYQVKPVSSKTLTNNLVSVPYSYDSEEDALKEAEAVVKSWWNGRA